MRDEFRIVRDAIEFGSGGDPNYRPFYEEGIAALSSIERHVQDMERALEWYAEWRNYRYPAGDDRLDEHNENYCAVIQNDRWLGGQPGSRARAALSVPADQEGEGT